MDADGTDVAVVHAWHDALNSGDLDRLMTLMHDDVAFGGPRGEGHGAALVREWAERSGIRLTPTRRFQRDGEVVVAQRAQWPDPDSGELTPPDDIASVFEVREGLVRRVVRYGSLQEALDVTRIDETSEWRTDPAKAVSRRHGSQVPDEDAGRSGQVSGL